jgi:hypothetical protein
VLLKLTRGHVHVLPSKLKVLSNSNAICILYIPSS